MEEEEQASHNPFDDQNNDRPAKATFNSTISEPETPKQASNDPSPSSAFYTIQMAEKQQVAKPPANSPEKLAEKSPNSTPKVKQSTKKPTTKKPDEKVNHSPKPGEKASKPEKLRNTF